MQYSYITSRDNPKIKAACGLKSKGCRQEARLALIEGENIISQIAPQRVRQIFVAESKLARFEGFLSGFKDAKIYVVDGKAQSLLSDTKTPQGIFAVIQTGVPNAGNGSPQSNLSALLDGISDPGNLGTIIRTCAAFNISKVYLRNCCDPYNGKAVRASLGGIFAVDLIDGEPAAANTATHSNTTLPSPNCEIWALDAGGQPVDGIPPHEVKNPVCLAVGSEAHGLSAEIKRLAKRVISIPMPGNMESLNAAVAFGIAAYETGKYLKSIPPA